ncbi:MAG TPA: hypothetical protein VN841_29730 [Bryobacteraceae bacterium]|nr:hypothetical protein [Bryobacteraceae bacterium]
MTMLYKNLIRASLVAGLALTASAAQIEGTLMDKMCSSAKKDAKTHERTCALSPACQKSGFVVATSDGKVLELDTKGNDQAVKALKASKKKDDLRVTVNGDVSGAVIKVASLKLL